MHPVKISSLKISAIAPCEREAGVYALFSENQLYLADAKTQTARKIAYLPNIQSVVIRPGDGCQGEKSQMISLCFHYPYVCIAERFGVNAALVNLQTGTVREQKREDYHSSISSYAVAFVEKEGRILFICQTQWNRLDIFDAQTGENLTERQVYFRDTGKRTEKGNIVFDQQNYLDFFHSQLMVSPDGKHFLSSGWIWQPYDRIYLFPVDEFMKTYELCGIFADSGMELGSNWDRPCTFIGNDTFAVVLDDMEKSGVLDEEDAGNYEYYQLVFFKTHVPADAAQCQERWIAPFRKLKCSVFTPDENGEVTGRLYYDTLSKQMIAITPEAGTFILSLDGETLEAMPEMKASHNTFKGANTEIGWEYCPAHHVFYTWLDGKGIVEKQWCLKL